MSLVNFICQSLPDAHKHIFEFHRQLALENEEYHLGELLREMDYLYVEDDYFDLIYSCELTPEEKTETAVSLTGQIDDSSSAIAFLSSYKYI